MSTFDQSPTSFFQQNIKKIITVFITIVVLIAGFVGIQKLLTPADSYKPLDTMVRPANPTTGKLDASVQLLYLYDYICPACQSNGENMANLEKDYGNKIKITYKHFITHSGPGDRAAQAAQGVNIVSGAAKFFEFSNALIKITPNYPAGVPQSNLEELVKSIGVDVPAWRIAQNSLEAEKNVKIDQKDIQNATLPVSKYPDPRNPTGTKPSSTPTLIILKDGKYTDSWWSRVLQLDTVKERLDQLISPK